MLGAGQIKEELPEIKQEPQDYNELAPNIFVKTEQPEEVVGSSTGRPAGTKVTYSVKSTTVAQEPPNKTAKLEGAKEPLKLEGVDPWYYKIPVYRRKEKSDVKYSKKYIQDRKLRIVKPRFIQNPGLHSQEELEKLMNELEEARKKDKPTYYDEYPCPVPGCIALFTSTMGLNRHKALHREIYKCGECQQVFKEKEDLEAHIRVHEGVDPPSAIVTAPAIPRTMRLVQCNYLQEPLPAEVKEEIDQKNAILLGLAQRTVFVCPVGCKRDFQSQEELQRHVIAHNMITLGLDKPKKERNK